jgi:putative sterol carrier protein
VRVPIANLIGQENLGFYYIMESFQLERLAAAVNSVAGSEYCLEVTLRYINEREAFSRPIAKFQAIRHALADLATELEAAKQLMYYTAWLHKEGEQAIKESSMSKLLAGELANRVVDKCVQCFGGYGYMEEYLIARAYRDVRVGTIVAGTSEIMREIISKIIIDEAQYESGYTKAAKKEQAEPKGTNLSAPPSVRDEGKPAQEPKPDKEIEPKPGTETHIPKTVPELFASLPGRFRPERAQDWNAVFHFDLSGDNGGQYTVRIQNGTCKVEEGLQGNADCVVKAKDKTYMDIELGKTNPNIAYMLGKVKVSSLSQMMRYIKVFRKLFKAKK